MFLASGNKKYVEVATLVSNTVDFKPKTLIRDKEGQYVRIKGLDSSRRYSNHKYTYTQHQSTQIYILLYSKYKHLWREKETVIVGSFSTPHSTLDRSSRPKFKNETLDLSYTLDQMDLDIYRTFHPKAAEYTFFSNTHGTFFKDSYILGH